MFRPPHTPIGTAARSILLTTLATTTLVAVAYAVASLFVDPSAAMYVFAATFANLVPAICALAAFHHVLVRRQDAATAFTLSLAVSIGGFLGFFFADVLFVNAHISAPVLFRGDYEGWLPAVAMISIAIPLFHRRVHRAHPRQRVLQDLFN